MSGETYIPMECGDGKLSGDGGAEYPCVKRYRHRRLLAFLWHQGMRPSHELVLSESDAIMWVPHLQQLVARGQWQDADRYILRFLSRDTSLSASVEADVLLRIFEAFNTLADIVVGGKELVMNHQRNICRGQRRLRSIVLYVQQARALIDWDCVTKMAGHVTKELAYATPELEKPTSMPHGLMEPHNVLPTGFGFRRRCRPKKQQRQPNAAALARGYLDVKWRSLPASSDPSKGKYDASLKLSMALDRMADILEQCINAGTIMSQVRPLMTTKTEVTGTAAAPVLQTISSTCPAIYTGIPSVANAGKLASHVPSTGAPFFGTVDAPLLQPLFSNLTSGCGNSGMGLMANAGATTAPVSRNVCVTPGMPMPLANAGKSACHALTPGGQVSSTVVNCLTSRAENSKLPLTINAESGHQAGLSSRKNPREETTTTCDGQGRLHTKRQRTTGALDRAGLQMPPAAAIET